MNASEIAARLQERFGADVVLETDVEALDPFCTIDPMSIDQVCEYCCNELGFNYLACLSGMDWTDKKKTTDDLGVVYHLQAIPDATLRFCLKVRLSREDPKTRSVEKVWRTADWHEREAWDMFGIEFEGHPDMRRILCADDWEGHALRKDYKSPDTYHGIKNNVV